MSTRHASCSCGKLSIATHGEPLRISVCHCLACQKRTGSVFGMQACFATGDVAVEGDSREYVRVAESGNAVRFHFSPECGATVFWQLDSIPGAISVSVGAFADRGFPPPRVSVYGESMHHWVRLPDSIEHFE